MPSQIAIVYGTTEGQTRKISEHIANTLDERNCEVVILSAKELPDNFAVDDFDAVIVGASIHAGKYQKEVVEFVGRHHEQLQNRPSAFFSVSLSEAGDDEQAKVQIHGFIDKFMERTGWHPLLVASFGGALPYTKYGFMKRMIMKSITKRAGGDIDTSRDYEYTDWSSVDHFAENFRSFLRPGGEQQHAASGPTP
ncbi:MAG: menaquinone-dependent protoporphyrinogen IX dehydrogenase [Bradymonadaceae bacterium]|nr:menaquinone-dependent protoporphyrinogen IX dehydrogenase [Lujinxingiaceae bacterium]